MYILFGGYGDGELEQGAECALFSSNDISECKENINLLGEHCEWGQVFCTKEMKIVWYWSRRNKWFLAAS